MFYELSDFIFHQDYEFINECAVCGEDFSTVESLLLHMAEHKKCNDGKCLFEIDFSQFINHKYFYFMLFYHYRKSWFR